MDLSRIVLKGFKSIRECDLVLKNLNILIGPNGAGKSNFIGFFTLLRNLLDGTLQVYIGKQGGADALLHFGRKKTQSIRLNVYLPMCVYGFFLEPTNDNTLLFARESLKLNADNTVDLLEYRQQGHRESHLAHDDGLKKGAMWKNSFDFRTYHFHDTGKTALLKQRRGINDNMYLRGDASNLAAFLYRLKQEYPRHYQEIVQVVQLVTPFFHDFHLRPNSGNTDYIELEWFEYGADVPFKASAFSDGTLRFICLATALLQPPELQSHMLLFDEPELGLHPAAISTLAGLLRSVASEKQIVVSTQSTDLLNEFEANDVIVTERTQSGTHFRRLEDAALREWLEEYSLGELWNKNIFGGRPV